MAKNPYDKLSPRYYGPYKVLYKVGTVSTFPCSHSRYVPHFTTEEVIGKHPVSPTIPAQLFKDMTLDVSPHAVIGVKTAPHNPSAVIEVLIRWTDATLFNLRFPEFHLEDKVAVWQRGNPKAQA